MAWLISYEYIAVYRNGEHFSRIGPEKMLCLIDNHPAQFVADQRKAIDWLYSRNWKSERTGDNVAYEIQLIHSAIKVPDDLLNEDEVDRLS